MLPENKIQELLDIRKQMDELQARYNAIMAEAGAALPAQANLAPIPVPHPVTTQQNVTPPVPQPLPVAAPVQTAQAPAPVSAPPPAAAPAPAPVNAPVAQPAPQPAASGSPTLSDCIVYLLKQSPKPLNVNTIYAKLQEAGAPLPADKPLLVIRKLLYDKTLFRVVAGGLFELNPGVAVPSEPPFNAAKSAAKIQEPAPTPVTSPAASVAPTAPLTRPAGNSFANRLDSILGNGG